MLDLTSYQSWLDAANPPPWQIQTSGSTGQPKTVLLSREAILASVAATTARIGSGRWGLLLPPNYIAGTQVIFRSLVAGFTPVIADTAASASSADFLAIVPTQLQRMLADPNEAAALAEFQAVLIGGSACPPQLRQQARAAGVNAIVTYGMAETAGGCVYDGSPLSGVRLRINPAGLVEIAGPMLFSGYAEPGFPGLSQGWFTTADLGSLNTAGELQVLGRSDGVINTGGVKVVPEVVAEILAAAPEVAEVMVVGAPDSEWGEQVVAVLVGTLSLASAKALVREVRPDSWAPKTVVTVAELPKLANRKPDLQAIKSLATSALATNSVNLDANPTGLLKIESST